MSEQNDSLELAVNNLAAEMRRGIYIRDFLGTSGNTKRPTLYQEFGYPRVICFRDFYNMYRRNAAGFAVVHRLLDGCWQDYPDIVEGDEAEEAKEETPWEKNVTKLLKKQWVKIKDADRRNLVGRYSALLIQVKDNQQWDQPITPGSLSALGEKALIRLIPVWEEQITVAEWDNNQMSETFGQPTMYNFSELPVGEEQFIGPIRYTPIHPDRVIVFCEGSEDENMLSGVPLLEAGYNKLLDIEKISGGGAEGFLKNASRQIAIQFSKDTDMAELASQAKAAGYTDLGQALGDKVNKLNRGTDAAAVMQAGEMNVLSVAPGDPGPTWEVTANELAASVQIPFTILFGQQTGRLASDEDKTDWAIRRNTRRNNFLTDRITALLERLWTIGVIPPPPKGEVTVVWPDLLAPSQAEKIANMSAMADVAVKTTNAFGRSALEENEIRTAGELQPLPELDIEMSDDEKDDPLSGDEADSKAEKPDNSKVKA